MFSVLITILDNPFRTYKTYVTYETFITSKSPHGQTRCSANTREFSEN